MSEPTEPTPPVTGPPVWSPPGGAVPPTSPPVPGYPSSPPLAGGVPLAPPTAEVPVVPPVAAPYPGAAPAAPAAGPTGGPAAGPAAEKGSMGGCLKLALAAGITVVVVGAVLALTTVLSGAPASPTVTVAQCSITPRGEVVAGGEVANNDDEPRTVRLEVRLSSVRGGSWVRTAQVERRLAPGGSSGWTASDAAPSNVEQVRCAVTEVEVR